MTDITELAPAMKAAAEKYRLTLEAYRNNPRDYDTVAARDEATSEFMELVDSDELNIISGLVEALESQGTEIESMRNRIEEQAKSLEVSEERRVRWFQIAQELGEKLDCEEERIAELESRTVKLPPLKVEAE
ncbi:hypothetical protein ACEB63_005004 [Raoultella planticola]